MNQYRHARISQYVPQGYNQAVLDNAAQFADRLGDILEQNGRNATLFINVAKSGNVYLQTGDKQMIFLNQESLKGNPNEVSGYISKENPDNALRNMIKSVSAGKQQGNQQNSYNGNSQYTGRPAQNSYHNNGYQNGYNGNQGGYVQNPQSGYQRNGYNAGNSGYNGYANSNAHQQNHFAPSLVGIGTGLDKNAPDVKAAAELGNQIGSRLGIQSQNKLQIWVNRDNFGGLSLSLKTDTGTVYFNLNQKALQNGKAEITKISDLHNGLQESFKKELMTEFGSAEKLYMLSQETSSAVKNGDRAIGSAVSETALNPLVSKMKEIISKMPEKPSYISNKDGRFHPSSFIAGAKHRANSPAVSVTISIADKENYLNIGLSYTSIQQGNPAVKYMTITPQDSQNTVLQNLMTAIENSPEIAKAEGYHYHAKQEIESHEVHGNPERITATPERKAPAYEAKETVHISDMVNVQDSFIMQGLEKMKALAQNIQSTLEHNGMQTSPVIFVGKHGNPPAYVANIEIADKNCQMKLYVNDSSLKSESKPHIYDFSVYDHARGIQGKEEQLTQKMQSAVQILQDNGYFKETELQRFAREYNQNPEHQTTTAVYHRTGDIYSDFGKTAHVNTEMVEILANNGDNRAIPRAFLNARTGEIDVLVKTPTTNIMSSQLSPELTEKLTMHYLSAESMQAVCRIAKIPEPQNKVKNMLHQAENSGIHTASETPQPRKDFLADIKVTVSIDNQQFSHKPEGREIGGIKMRLAQNPSREYSIRDIINASDSGRTVCPAVIVPTENKNGTLSHNENGWKAQQMFFIDIDNSIPDTHIPLTKEQGFLTMQEAINRCAENQINVVSAYESFSSNDKLQRFRLTVLLPEPVTSLEEQHKIVQGLTSVFGQAADQKCFNGDRIFFGNAPNQHTYQIVHDEQHLYTAKETLLNLYEKNVVPYQQNPLYDDAEDYVGNLFEISENNPEEDLYVQMERLENQGFQGTLQELKQAVGYQGSIDALKDYAENCGFEKLIIEQKAFQDKFAE